MHQGHIDTMSQNKVGQFYFCDNFGQNVSMFTIFFFIVKLRKDLPRKLKLKLPPYLKSVAALLWEM